MTEASERLAVLEAKVNSAVVEIAELKADRKNALIWGVLVLGAAVMTLGGFIVAKWHNGG